MIVATRGTVDDLRPISTTTPSIESQMRSIHPFGPRHMNRVTMFHTLSPAVSAIRLRQVHDRIAPHSRGGASADDPPSATHPVSDRLQSAQVGSPGSTGPEPRHRTRPASVRIPHRRHFKLRAATPRRREVQPAHPAQRTFILAYEHSTGVRTASTAVVEPGARCLDSVAPRGHAPSKASGSEYQTHGGRQPSHRHPDPGYDLV